MPENNNEQPKQSSRQQRGDASNDNQQVSNREGTGETGARGEAIIGAGNKVHGDKLEGVISGEWKSQNDRAETEDDSEDRDDDGEGELK